MVNLNLAWKYYMFNYMFNYIFLILLHHETKFALIYLLWKNENASKRHPHLLIYMFIVEK